MNPSDAIKLAREKTGMTQLELAVKCGVAEKTIRNWESGNSKLNTAKLNKISDALSYPSWGHLLRDIEGGKPSNEDRKRIPILSQIPASWENDSITSETYHDVTVDHLPPLPGIEDLCAFGLIITDDSMMPRYQEGEIVVCSPSEWQSKGFEDGRRYAMRFSKLAGGSTTIKRVHRVNDEHIDLIPENDRHPTRRVKNSDIITAADVVGRYVKE